MLQKHMLKTVKLEYITVLMATGMPGLYRIATLYALNYFFGLEVVGEVSSNWSIIQAASMFSVVGWTALLLSKLPGKTLHEQNNDFLNILYSSLITCVALLLVVGFYWEASLWLLIVFLVSWSIYSLIRQKLIIIQKYQKLIFIDIIDLLLTLIFVFLIEREFITITNYDYVIIFPVIILSACYLIDLIRTTKITFLWEFEKAGVVFGLNNFISGGIAFLLVPLIENMAGKEAAGIYGLIISLTNIALLFPRALSNYFSPELAKSILVRSEVMKKIMARFVFINNSFLLLIAVFICSLWSLWKQYYLNINNDEYFILFLITVLCTVIGQVNLPLSRWLIIREKSGLLLFFGTVTAFFFVLALLIIYFINPLDTGLNNFVMILISLFGIYVVRNVIQYFFVKNDLSLLVLNN